MNTKKIGLIIFGIGVVYVVGVNWLFLLIGHYYAAMEVKSYARVIRGLTQQEHSGLEPTSAPTG